MIDMEIRPLAGKERLYVYRQSQQIGTQAGLIGYLRADMDTDGQGFFSSWFGFQDGLKTEEFKEEFDMVVNKLRFDEEYGGALSSRSAMAKFCRSQPESAFSGSYTTEYGFRVNTGNYAYLMRMIPVKGEYNLYCYCYRRDWLDSHLHRAEKGIRFITPEYKELFRVEDGDQVRIVTDSGEYRDRTVRYIDETHMELGNGFRDNLYHICEFAERFQKTRCQELIPLRASLPEKCYSSLLETGKVVILKKGETGYYPADVSASSKEEAQQIVDAYNGRLGVTRAQEEAMKAGSMFGFAVPAADPKNYDAHGTPVKHRRDDRGDR